MLDRAAERFRAGHEAHHIQIFLEEAHRLFDRDRFQTRPLGERPLRPARARGRQVQARDDLRHPAALIGRAGVLDNTANWVVAHLNSETEIESSPGATSSLDSRADPQAEDIGFVRLKTLSSRFIIPVQVRQVRSLGGRGRPRARDARRSRTDATPAPDD